eukprot:6995658-Ditylum_brightwellii.AAC.1
MILPRIYQFIRPNNDNSKLHDRSSSKHKTGPQQDTHNLLLYKFQAVVGCEGDVGPVGERGDQGGQRAGHVQQGYLKA